MKPLLREKKGEKKMIAIDGSYLYKVGGAVHPLTDISSRWTYEGSWFALYVAEGELERFTTQSVFRLPTSQPSAQKLIEAIRVLRIKAEDVSVKAKNIADYDAYQLSSALSAFEAVLAAEFGMASIFLVTPKRGYETRSLIDYGQVLFPIDLPQKVPKAVHDINQATRCIAFELPTAAGFHLHRANESVLHCYFDVVTNNSPHPRTRNIGDYLAEFSRRNVGDAKIISALKDLKDLHRNPLIHPQDSLESVDEAIALLGSIQAVVVHMLKAIPLPASAAPPAAVSGPSVPSLTALLSAPASPQQNP